MLGNDDFFKEESEEQGSEESEKIKVGEKEYTPDELNRLVGLGEIAVEAEEKYNRPISKFWPEYTNTKQELARKDAELEELRKVAQNPKVQETLTDQEQTMQRARQELKALGYLPADEVDKMVKQEVLNAISGVKLIDKVEKVVSKHASDGNPSASVEDIIGYMQETNINDPEIAYKIKFEKELDAIKEKKLASLKSSGLVTESSSTAGGKQPAPTKVTKANLQEVLSGYIRR